MTYRATKLDETANPRPELNKPVDESGTAPLSPCYLLSDEVLRNMAEGVNVTDDRGIIIFTNPAFDQMFGYEKGELIGRNVSVLNAAEEVEKQRLISQIVESLRTKGVWKGEFTNRRKQGSTFITQAHITALFEGPTAYWICVQEDISDRKEHERLRERLASIIQCSEDAIMNIDPSGIVTDWNPGAERMFGYAAAEIIGKSITLLHPTSDEILLCGRVADGQRIKHYETKRVRKDGTILDVSLSLCPISDDAGKLLGVGGIARDITERKRAEAKIMEWKTRYETALRASGQIFYDWEPSSDLITYAGSFERVLGYSRDEIARLSWKKDIIHPEDRLACESTINQMLSLNRGYHLEYRAHAKDGRYLDVQEDGYCLYGDKGEILRILGFVVDISQRKSAERQVLANLEELKRSNMELDSFARVLSHDLQEPIRMVSCYAELLVEKFKERFGTATDQDADLFLSFVQNGAQTIKRMIDGVLAYSRVGREHSGFQPVDCGLILRQAQQDLSLLIRESSATITSDPLPQVIGNSILIARIFQNLLTNAIKFRSALPPEIHVSAVRCEGFWQLIVRDNGMGFDSSQAKKIFFMFQRLHDDDKYAGQGIGLAVCKKIVECHGGSIWAESEVGRGSTFHFTLPAVSHEW